MESISVYRAAINGRKNRMSNHKENMFAKWLTDNKIEHKHNSHVFILKHTPKNLKYTPDFYLPKEDKYIEVIGNRQTYHSRVWKYKMFKEQYPDIKYDIMDYRGYLFKTRGDIMETKSVAGITITIRITQEEYDRLYKLRAKYSQHDIFKHGLDYLYSQEQDNKDQGGGA
jgi:hypothetical protein